MNGPWKQLLPGAIEPDRGVTYEFKDWVGRSWRGVFDGLRPDAQSRQDAVLVTLRGSAEESWSRPIWFREVIDED